MVGDHNDNGSNNFSNYIVFWRGLNSWNIYFLGGAGAFNRRPRITNCWQRHCGVDGGGHGGARIVGDQFARIFGGIGYAISSGSIWQGEDVHAKRGGSVVRVRRQ